ncbi:MAG: tetratricopeptide repeat protein [Elusimicrobiota bacterium]
MKKNATLLFIDLIGSSNIANILSLEQYDRFLTSFHNVCISTIKNYFRRFYTKTEQQELEFSVKGDECSLFLYTREKARDLKIAIEIALQIKRRWLTEKINRDRVKQDKSPFDVGIGIHYGQVILNPRFCIRGKKISAEGFNISVAKRAESVSRQGKYTKIMVTREAYFQMSELKIPVSFTDEMNIGLKDVGLTINVYEIRSYGLKRRKAFAPGITKDIGTLEKLYKVAPFDLWLGLRLVENYLKRQDEKRAESVLKRMLIIDPKYAEAHFYLGFIYDGQNNSVAVDEYNKVLEIVPDDIDTLYNLGLFYKRMKRLQEALKALQQFLMYAPATDRDYERVKNIVSEIKRKKPMDNLSKLMQRAREEGKPISLIPQKRHYA